MSDLEPSDDALTRAWQDGDDDAFRRLLDRHGPSVMGFLVSLVADRPLAEDAWSETFLRAIRARDRYIPDGRFRAWLFTIARRCGKDVLRSRRRWSSLTRRLWRAPPRLEPPRSPESEVLSAEVHARLWAALDQLPPRHREVLLLVYQQGMDTSEVAEVLDLSPQQVRSRVTYARRLLAEIVDAP